MNCLSSSQIHPHLVPGMEKVPESVGSLNVWRQYLRLHAGLVPACLWLVTSSPGWGLPTVPRRRIKELREAPGWLSCRLGRRQVSKALPSPGRPGGTTTGSQQAWPATQHIPAA